MHHTDLDTILKMYADHGIRFVVIEGYKQRSYAKIVIGSLEIDHCVLKDPTPEDVIGALHLFDDYK